MKVKPVKAIKTALKVVAGTLASVGINPATDAVVYVVTHGVKVNGVWIEVSKIGIGYEGSYQLERAYRRVLSNFCPMTRFELGKVSKERLNWIETQLHNIAATTYFQEVHESGKKTEKFHCSHDAAVNMVEAFLKAL